MSVRYFNIKTDPNHNGSAIKIDTENSLDKKVEDLLPNYSFEKIKENENYTHFEMYENNYWIGDLLVKIGSREPKANICIDKLGNMRFYKNISKYFSKEITKEKAQEMEEHARNWRQMQIWAAG